MKFTTAYPLCLSSLIVLMAPDTDATKTRRLGESLLFNLLHDNSDRGAPTPSFPLEDSSNRIANGESIPKVWNSTCFGIGHSCNNNADCCDEPNATFEAKLVCYLADGAEEHKCYPNWGYGNGFLEPDEWEESYPLCTSKGKTQGPTDVPLERSIDELERITPDFTANDNCKTHTFRNDAWKEDAAFELAEYEPDAERCSVKSGLYDGLEYTFRQFHNHIPAESHVNGTIHDVEIHFYHSTGVGNNALILLFVIFLDVIADAQENPYLQEVIQAVEGTPAGESSTFTTTQTYADFIDIEGKTWLNFPAGSTSPPCQERIEMWMALEAIPITQAQFDALYKTNSAYARNAGKNARPVQPFNDRFIRPDIKL